MFSSKIMKKTPLSTCEKHFIKQTIKFDKRLDGRKNDEFRPLNISYGTQWGSALVSLGETKVLAQVSAELGEPKATRPNEGILYINVEIGPMAAANFEAGRNCETTVQINRTLEKTFKDSRFIDLESLCVISEECVWILRADLNVLNHDGNLIDCCSIATLCAFAHFRRMDVSIVEKKTHMFPNEERELLSVVLHHHPVCVSYVVFNEENIAVADPTCLEERTADSQMTFGINSHKELCSLNFGGSSLNSSTLLLQSSNRAANRAKYVVDSIKKSLDQDLSKRLLEKNFGFMQYLQNLHLNRSSESHLLLNIQDFKFQDMCNSSPLDAAINNTPIPASRMQEIEDAKTKNDKIYCKLSPALIDLQQSVNDKSMRRVGKVISSKHNFHKNYSDNKHEGTKWGETFTSDSEEEIQIVL